jgi:hypothetical protein
MANETEALLSKVLLAYHELTSYSDQGHVEAKRASGSDEADIKRLKFATHFKRPNCFRFEWRESL